MYLQMHCFHLPNLKYTKLLKKNVISPTLLYHCEANIDVTKSISLIIRHRLITWIEDRRETEEYNGTMK